MKIKPAAADRFAAAPPASLRAVLVYGPDTGLVRERATRLVKAVAEDPADPFRVVELAAAAVRDDPARLADEAAAMSLTGGRRAVRVRDAGDSLADAVEAMLESAAGDALVVVEAGNLGPRSKLRKLFEDAQESAAAVACYADDTGALAGLVREVLGAHGLTASKDAMAFLCANLGGDRMVSRAELEKLALYAGGGDAKGGNGEVGFADAVACVGDSAAMALEDLAFAVCAGDLARIVRQSDRAFNEGVHAVGVLRAVARHVQRLHLVSGLLAGGAPVETALRRLRPPPFFKVKDAFVAQARLWTPEALDRAIGALIQAELDCKSTGAPDRALCSATLLRLGGWARVLRRRGGLAA